MEIWLNEVCDSRSLKLSRLVLTIGSYPWLIAVHYIYELHYLFTFILWLPLGHWFNSSPCIIDLHWDYNYYHSWSDNRWLMQERIDNNIIDDKIDNIDDRVRTLWELIWQTLDYRKTSKEVVNILFLFINCWT